MSCVLFTDFYPFYFHLIVKTKYYNQMESHNNWNKSEILVEFKKKS